MLALLVALMSASGCGGGRLAPVSQVDPTASGLPSSHTVRKGETVYAIAWLYGLDYREVAAWNALVDPHSIVPGQTLALSGPQLDDERTTTKPPPVPDDSAGVAAPASPEPTKAQSSSSTAKPEAIAESAADTPAPSNPDATSDSTDAARRVVDVSANVFDTDRSIDEWIWPTKGKVVGRFGKSGRNGVDISGRRGQSVIAASDGRVVYNGGGLIGYGKLIILKHNKRFLSAYAHNAEILVEEGDIVKGGQSIARMGSTGSNQVKLHFEIRRDGKPVNPLRYLPR